MITSGLIFVLLAMLVVSEYFHRLERQELYSRLMARDLTEYQAGQGGGYRPVPRNFVRKGMERSNNEMGRIEAGD